VVDDPLARKLESRFLDQFARNAAGLTGTARKLTLLDVPYVNPKFHAYLDPVEELPGDRCPNCGHGGVLTIHVLGRLLLLCGGLCRWGTLLGK